MNRNTILAWAMLMGLMLFWTSYKQKQAMAEMKVKKEQQRTDSLAQVAKNGGKSLNAATGPGGQNTAMTSTAALSPALNNSALSNSTLSSDKVLSNMGVDTTLALVAHQTLRVETKHFVVRLDNQGAKVTNLVLKDLDGKKILNPNLIAPDGDALNLTIDNQDLGKTIWRVDSKDTVLQVSDSPVTITFKCTLPGNKSAIVRSFTFYPDSNKFSQHLTATQPINSYTIGWQSGLEETEKISHGKGFGLMTNFFSEVIMDNGTNVQRETFEGKKSFNEQAGIIKWVGLRRKYVATLLNFNRETTNKVVAIGHIPEGEEKSFPKKYELQIVGNNYEDKDLDFDFVVLPLSYDGLLAHDQNYEKIIFSGYETLLRADIWYPKLCGFVLHTLNFFYNIIPNYGVAIILLTLLVRIITFPLTIAQTKQGVKMQQHMPAIAKIREKYKGQAQKANLEIMEYYKKEGVNPLSGVMGCFPVFLQMPIFISLFNVLGRAVELKGAPFTLWIHDLALPDVVYEAVKIPYIFPLGITILPFFMAITMYFQMKLSIKDPNQKMMVWMMPIMMFVFSCAFPSGLVLYWSVSNLFTIGQTYFYTNKLKPSPSKVIVSTVHPKSKV